MGRSTYESIEAVSATLQDIVKTVYEFSWLFPFGGSCVLCVGDFRQCLPVVPKGGRGSIMKASLSKSQLWQQMQVTKLFIAFLTILDIGN